jgi:hypothetical protein
MKLTLLLFTIILLCNCSANNTPNDILPLNQMSDLVQEITLLETHFQSKYGVPNQYKEALDLSIARVLKKAGCSKLNFEKSLKYYAAHPELQKELNEKLLTEMSRKIQ